MKKSPGSTEARKLMDRLRPDPAMGQLEGFLATTYEMQSDFLETDMLPTLFGLGAWDDRSWTSRISLERRLAELEAAVVLLDARAYRGRPRSLRVEINPVRPGPGRLLHAKVFVAVYENAVRMIIGSANLTEPGYRRNREIVAVLTATAERPGESALIVEALETLRSLSESCSTASAGRLCADALVRLREWASRNGDNGLWFSWGGGEEGLWSQFLRRWPPGESVRRIRIVSPFWSEEDEQGPVHTFVSGLRDRNLLSAPADLEMLTDAAPDAGGTFKPRLPASYHALDARSLGINAVAIAVDPRVPPEELGLGTGFSCLRSLHAKVVLMEGEETSLAYLGSANFTNRGWGFLGHPSLVNIEAGLIVRRSGAARQSLQALIPGTYGKPVPLDASTAHRLALPEPSPEDAPWPEFLRSVRLSPSENDRDRLDVVISVEPDRVLGPWSVWIPAQGDSPEEPLESWTAGGEPARTTYRLPLTDSQLPRLLREQEVLVRWWDCSEGRPVPLNVEPEARDSLPISPEGGRINEGHLIAYYQGRIAWEELFPDPEVPITPNEPDPKPDDRGGVDTSKIQSYVVREFVEALKGLNDDLKSAASSSRGCMRLALLGSVSPVALARQVLDAAQQNQRTAPAAGFQLVEILACLEISRNYCSSSNAADWSEYLGQAIARVESMFSDLRERFRDQLPREFHVYAKTIRGHHRQQASLG